MKKTAGITLLTALLLAGSFTAARAQDWHKVNPNGAQEYTLNSISGMPDGTVLSVGKGGRCVQVKDNHWQPLKSGTASHLNGIWCLSLIHI